MRVGLFTEFYEPQVNGTVVCVRTLRQSLESAGHDVKIFAPAPPGHDWSRGRRDADGVYRFRARPYPFHHDLRISFPLYTPLRRELDRLALDVVHSFTPFSTGIFAIRVARKLGIPHVHTYATRWPEYARLYLPGPAGPSASVIRRCSTVFYNLVDHVIVFAPPSEVELRGDGVATPISVLPLALTPDAFGARADREHVRRRYGIPVDAPLVLNVGRLGDEKGIDFLLRAFAHAARELPDARLLVVGEGPALGDLRRLAAELAIDDRVTFTGEFVDRATLLALYPSADVFAFAGRLETGPLVLLEAAAARLPLVARTDAAVADKVLPDVNGALCDEEPEFAAQLVRLLRDGDLARRFGSASLEVARRHAASTCAPRHAEVYGRAIERTARF
jgi:1,2-diacylglycerol 3-alpha-glucosyltransferase